MDSKLVSPASVAEDRVSIQGGYIYVQENLYHLQNVTPNIIIQYDILKLNKVHHL